MLGKVPSHGRGETGCAKHVSYGLYSTVQYSTVGWCDGPVRDTALRNCGVSCIGDRAILVMPCGFSIDGATLATCHECAARPPLLCTVLCCTVLYGIVPTVLYYAYQMRVSDLCLPRTEMLFNPGKMKRVK